MKSYRKELWFNVPGRRAFVNITPQVEDCVRESGIREGFALVNAMHITASVFINDDESGLHQDYEEWLEGLAPHEPTSRYRHNRTGEDNADAHLKRQVMGREVVVAVTGGRLDFGPWEQVFLRRVRWRAQEARPGQDHRGVSPRGRRQPSEQSGRRSMKVSIHYCME
jgi:secondary thiamine-phosphate synthase enzyme